MKPIPNRPIPDALPAPREGNRWPFTKEPIEGSQSYRFEAGPRQFDLRFDLHEIERCETMMDYIKRLRLCIRWFQELEGDYAFKHESLRSALELTEQKCAEMALNLKNKEEEIILIIVELRKSFATLQEKPAKEESDKLAAVDSLAREKETRIYIERSHASLCEDLGKAQAELQSSNQREYNSSLQHYNTKLQKEIDAAHESIKRG